MDSEESEDETERARRKIRKAKRACRSELSVSKGDWTRRSYATSNVLSLAGVVDTLPRVDARTTSWETFVACFESRRRPCIITHAMDDWPAFRGERAWTLEALRQRFAGVRLKVGSDDDGFAVRLRTEHFVAYASDPQGALVDDSPLYVFDGSLEREGSRALLADYTVPSLFPEDLFSTVGEDRRPPYRWAVFGPARSGSSLHIDPLATSAWNALIRGVKRWVLIAPGVPRASCRPRIPGVTDGEAVTWFTNILPRVQSADWPHARAVEAIQRPGEIMFVPNGWWHAVLNIEHTTAVTQNFVSSSNFDAAWRHTRKARPKLAVKWKAALRESRPDLAARADAIDAENQPCLSESAPSSSSSSSESEETANDAGRKRIKKGSSS